MYRRHSKRAQLIRRIMVYVLMVFSVVFLVGLILLFVLGYRLDSANRIERGTLVQFESSPSGGRVTIDDMALGAATPTKATVLAGTRLVTISRNGYETWQKSLNLVAGTLIWIDYPILIPKERPVEIMHRFNTLADVAASADQKRMLLQPELASAAFRLINLESNNASSTDVQLPAGIASQSSNPAKESFSIDQWDSDGRYVLLRHNFDDKKEWIVMDTQQPSRSKNITDTLGVNIEQIRFSGNSGNLFFARLNDGAIRKLDMNAQTISRSLVTGAISFSVYDSNIISYVADRSTTANKEFVAGIYKDGETSAVNLLTAKSNAGLKIATTRYVNNNYIAISAGKSVTIYKGNYPRTANDVTDLQTYASFTFTENVETMTFSREGTYLLVQSGKDYLSFDMESKVSHGSRIDTNVTSKTPLRWIAPGYLFSDYGNDLILREFDGTNIHTITQVAPGFDATFTPNARYLYSIGKTDDGYSLQRVKMILN